jgi:hypothetical protein
MDYIVFYRLHVEGLKKAGKNHSGYCPFHADKGTKEKVFSVDPETGLWFCYGSCNTGGNAITFCQKANIPIDEAPDYKKGWNIYHYGMGISKAKPGKKLKDEGRHEKWLGTKGEGLPSDLKPYNHLALDHARELKRLLWICEGEKDTLTMLKAGELAIGLPSASMDKVLDAIPFENMKGISFIIAMGHNDAGKQATERILNRFPWALTVEWPEDKPKGFDVTNLKKGMGEGFVDKLKEWVTETDSFKPLTKHIADKYEMDMSRNPDKLLGYDLTKFGAMAKNIDGIQPGFYVIGAETNAGKTAFLCNLTLDLLDSNKDLTGIYFSLDESRDVILSRFLSIKTGIPLNQVRRPQQTGRHKDMLLKGYKYLRDLAKNKRLFIRDVSEIQGVWDLEDEIKRRMNHKLFIVIDALHNLDMGMDPMEQRRENIERADRLKALATMYYLPVICTGELRKKERKEGEDKAPTIHDLMGGGKFAYNASLVLMIYPDNWEDYNTEDEPILKMQYEKNKLSHYRGIQYLRFIRKEGRLKESIQKMTPPS